MVGTEPVEILMATYNGAPYLREQMDSILAQSDGSWHLTVSDDGSEDETPEIIDDYAGRFPGKITRYHTGRRFGNARDHFFRLIKQSGAEWMLFCDQDDTWYPEKVAKTRQAIKEAEARYGAETPLLVFSDQTPADAQLRPLAPSLMRYQNQYFGHFDYRSILMQNVVTGGAMAINRPLAELAGRCGDTSRVIMHDWWIAAVAARFGKIIYLDEPLGTYRQHGKNAVGAKAAGSAGYFFARLAALGDVKRTIAQKKTQAVYFGEVYGALLGDEDKEFLSAFGKKRSGPLFYIRRRSLIHGAARKIGFALLG